MPLFVVLREGATLDEDLTGRVKASIRETLSPRHVPDAVFAVPDVPRTLSGKKLEIPIKKLFAGVPIAQAANLDAMSNPDVMQHYADLVARIRS
jgi:acetoacetyl-CoA synthetase